MSHGSSKHALSSQDLATAKHALEALQSSVIVKVIATRNPLSELFRRFAADLASISDKLQPLYLTFDEDGSPAIEIKPNLRYLALPNGRELFPFLQSLIFSGQGKVSLSTRSLSSLESFITPTQVEVMISPTCPHCPKVVGLVNQLALASTYLQVSIIDVTLFFERAESHGIRGVPTVVIDEQDQLVGVISEEFLVDRLVHRAVSASHPETFKEIVKQGDATKLAAMMVADCDLYSGALDLLADSDWSVRLGMMVVLEEVAESNAKLVRQAFPYLLALLDHEEANLRGDAAYLLGRIGDASTLSRLEEVTADENSEVTEAVREAIEQIRERQASGLG